LRSGLNLSKSSSFCLLKQITFEFITLDYNYKLRKVGEILKEDKLDIEVDRCGFIIKKNVIDAFKIGLMNDH
jgi:hypothetical protein